MEPNAATSTDLNQLDDIPINDQQLYDWGIEHRMDQYYGNPDQPSTLPYQPPNNHQQNNNKTTTIGYILPEHVQNQENAYLVTITDDNQSKTIKNGLNLPGNSHQVKMEKRYSKPANIKPNGVPGRRPILPTVDMDANEVLKVERKRARNRVAASKCRMRKLERIAVLDQQANQLRSENEQLAKLADKLRSQMYTLKQELRWHINNGCRISQQNMVDNHDFLMPTTVDKSTETQQTKVFEHFHENSPDSTTCTTNTSLSIKKEPFEEQHRASSSAL